MIYTLYSFSTFFNLMWMRKFAHKCNIRNVFTTTWTLSKQEGVAVFRFYSRTILNPHAEKHEEKISNMISYTAQVKWKSWLELDLKSHLQDSGPPFYLLRYGSNRDWRRVLFISSARNIFTTTWTLSKQEGCASVSILLQNHPQRNI